VALKLGNAASWALERRKSGSRLSTAPFGAPTPLASAQIGLALCD